MICLVEHGLCSNDCPIVDCALHLRGAIGFLYRRRTGSHPVAEKEWTKHYIVGRQKDPNKRRLSIVRILGRGRHVEPGDCRLKIIEGDTDLLVLHLTVDPTFFAVDGIPLAGS